MYKDVAKDSIANWVRFGIFLAKNWEVISKWVQNVETDLIIVKEVKKSFQKPGSLMELSLFFFASKSHQNSRKKAGTSYDTSE